MTSKVLRLGVVGLTLLSLGLLAEISPAAEPRSPGCQTKLIDLTDPGLAQKLASWRLEPRGPMTVQYQSDSKTRTKISSRKFVAYSEQVDASIMLFCELTCSGQGCAQTGCSPSASGCTPWECGTGCSGSCKSRWITPDE